MPKEKIELQTPHAYSLNNPIHMAIFGYNGVGKTTFLFGRDEKGGLKETDLRFLHLDCGDAGAITLRHAKPKNLRIVKIKNIVHYLDTIQWAIAKADQFDILVPDTVTGLQTMAIKEVKPKRSFDMNQKKWGMAGSRVIECLSETRNFPGDVLYLIQEKKKKAQGEESNDFTSPSLTPSIKGYMSSIVDWVGWLHVGSGGHRYLDFRISDELEAKDRADLFPKLIKNPSYPAIRRRIMTQLKGEGNAEGSKENSSSAE